MIVLGSEELMAIAAAVEVAQDLESLELVSMLSTVPFFTPGFLGPMDLLKDLEEDPSADPVACICCLIAILLLSLDNSFTVLNSFCNLKPE